MEKNIIFSNPFWFWKSHKDFSKKEKNSLSSKDFEMAVEKHMQRQMQQAETPANTGRTSNRIAQYKEVIANFTDFEYDKIAQSKGFNFDDKMGDWGKVWNINKNGTISVECPGEHANSYLINEKKLCTVLQKAYNKRKSLMTTH